MRRLQHTLASSSRPSAFSRFPRSDLTQYRSWQQEEMSFVLWHSFASRDKSVLWSFGTHLLAETGQCCRAFYGRLSAPAVMVHSPKWL